MPSYFEWIAEFPRTASGKRDDALLADLPLSAARTGSTRPRR